MSDNTGKEIQYNFTLKKFYNRIEIVWKKVLSGVFILEKISTSQKTVFVLGFH